MIEMRLGDLAERQELTEPRIREKDVEAALLVPHDGVEPVKVVKVRHVALNASDVAADGCDSRIELDLPAPGDEDVGALGGETLRTGEADPAVGAGDDGDFSFEPAHA
jgi:hypothetical protein